MKNEIVFLSATRMAELIRKKEISSEELVRLHLEQIEAVNGPINAVVHLCAENALVAAREKDEALRRGELSGPLHGVPVTIKDSLETEGVVSTSGTLGRVNYLPDRDASTVALMREAGAVMLGKTNVPELCLAFESDNLIYGRTNNPYDLSRTSGGSSGGEAAAIAAGCSPLGLGSDAGGSVRLPAHFCGITALKPTSGRLPKTGHFLPPGGIVDRLWQVGPMARQVEDLALVMPVLAQMDWMDPSVVAIPSRDPHEVQLKGLRVAVYTDNGAIAAGAETAQIVTQAARLLESEGAYLDEARPDRSDTSPEMWFNLLCPDGGAGLRQLLAMIGSKRSHPFLERFVAATRALSPAEYAELIARWDGARTRMLGFLTKFDAIVCPVAASPAIPHASSFDQMDIFTYTMDFNFSGWPAASVRCGTSSDGLPIGVQVVAHPWREDVVLALAERLEKAFGGWQAPSGKLEEQSA